MMGISQLAGVDKGAVVSRSGVGYAGNTRRMCAADMSFCGGALISTDVSPTDANFALTTFL